MIRLLYAPPGWGKTAAMTALGIEDMHGENAMHALQEANAEVAMLKKNGFNVSPPRSNHLVYCSKNYAIDVTSPEFGHRRSLVVDPERLGIAVEGFTPQYVYRGSTLLIDELPKFADSRNWQEFLNGMCLYWAEHRKHKINMLATCQDVAQVEKRIRTLAMITQVRSINFVYDKFDEVIRTEWEFYNWPCYEDWAAQKDPSIEPYIYNGDIRQAYNTYEGEQQFYIGLEKSDFSCEYSPYPDYTPRGIAEYGKKNAIAKTK